MSTTALQDLIARIEAATEPTMSLACDIQNAVREAFGQYMPRLALWDEGLVRKYAIWPSPGATINTSSGPHGVAAQIYAITAGGSILLGEAERSDQHLAMALVTAALRAKTHGEGVR